MNRSFIKSIKLFAIFKNSRKHSLLIVKQIRLQTHALFVRIDTFGIALVFFPLYSSEVEKKRTEYRHSFYLRLCTLNVLIFSVINLLTSNLVILKMNQSILLEYVLNIYSIS